MLLISTARVVLAADHGSCPINWNASPTPPPVPLLAKPAPPRPRPLPSRGPELEFFNGLGGFAAGGKEYVSSSVLASRLRPRG